jgi:inorganic pyrophosphatase
MAKRSKSRRSGLADPTTLAAIEGNRNKYAYDPKERIFALKKVLPAGMAFPYDFGFVPSTQSGDGDPLDVLVLMDEPAFPGVKLSCRIVGVIQGEQGTKNNTERNDRIVAIENQNHSYAHRLSGKEYRILGLKGPAAATRCIKRARTHAR